jgi:GNAT superfamily N-acetyltransferase
VRPRSRPHSLSVGIDVRPARAEEGERLREIARASKSHWGYDSELVGRWLAGGDYSAEGLARMEVFVAEADGRAVAWAALEPKGDIMWLADMWVDPPWIGRGVGTLLFNHAVDLARELGGKTMEWEAEPNAVGFYERMGGRHLRASEPTEFGRVVPVMGMDL